MKFSQIEMLFLIWAIPVFFLVVVYGMKTRQNILARFASPKGLGVIAPDAGTGRRWIKAGLVLCSLFFICLALSGPQYGYKWQTIEQKGVDIIVAIDLSRSMLATDIQPTRLDRAKREIYDLLSMLKGDRMGLVAFAGTAFLQCPLTLDYEAFHIFLNSLTPDFMPIGGTDISGALAASLSAFDLKATSQKAVILITDGENTGKADPLEAAEIARKAGVKLFCIGVGSNEGVPIPSETGGIKKDRSGNIILTRIDEETLKKMAVLTGGAFVRSVAGSMDLDVIYTNEIRGKIEASTLSTDKKQIWEDRFQWVLALAVIALGAELFVPAVRKKAAVLGMMFLLLWSVPVHAGNPLKEGIDAYNQGAYEKALKLFIDAQLDNPDRPDILYNIGNAYYHNGDYEAAAKNYKEALKTENKLLQQKAHYNLGNADFRKKQYEDAVKNYEEALKLNPDDIQARQNLEYVKKVMDQIKEQQNQQQKGDKNDKKADSEPKKQNPDPSKEGQDPEKKSDQEDKSQDGQGNPSNPDEKNAAEDKPSPDFGNETEKDGQGSDTQKETAAKESGQKKSEDPKGQGAAPSKPAGEPENAEEKNRAEHILNRLKDQPGKAMIPAYGKTNVEKDW
ncbi:MAG: VWA domain-containing protein [Desulfatirhabdiaceae bacterium]|nr:VWA domain-containing protein [Desulfatirhabdiaceae bacterium]